jgi:hypothetical protein
MMPIPLEFEGDWIMPYAKSFKEKWRDYDSTKE